MATPAPRIVVITGAAAGIGLATARQFAAAGDTVVLTDVELALVEECAAALGDPHVGLAMDVSNESTIIACMAAVARRFGGIDVLVNNAGIVDPSANRLFDSKIDEVRRMIAVNLHGCYVAAREAGRIMLEQGSGSIVNLSSGAALAALPGRTPYSMTKAAILGLTRTLAHEWAGRGVRVNAVLPGYVRTKILTSLERAGKFDSSIAGTAVPIGRMAEPEEIAAAIFHLAGAGYVTGASFVVDGAYAAFGGRGAASSSPVTGHVPAGVVIVAGAGTGIGSAIADHFVAQHRRVVVLDSDAERVAALPTDRLGIALDLTDQLAVHNAVRDLASSEGAIAILVNTARNRNTFDARAESPAPTFQSAFEDDVTGVLIVARAVAEAMVAAGSGGAIVNVLPPAVPPGVHVSNADSTAKAALTMLTKSLACEWAEHGIRVNAVAPGIISTAELATLPRSDRDLIEREIPMGRLGKPSEVAEATAFLASDLSSYVSGMSYAVDGGYSAS